MRPYADRHDAGRKLAVRLAGYQGEKDGIVLGLPRGGVVVAFEIAKFLGLPLDIFTVRKLNTPGFEELAMGAVASQGVQVFNRQIIERLHISQEAIDHEVANELDEISRRELLYRQGRSSLAVKNRHVILVDDGLATGATLKAAILALHQLAPRKITVAVPVGASDSCIEIEREVDEMICPFKPEPFRAVGHWYDEFDSTDDEIVTELLHSPTSMRI